MGASWIFDSNIGGRIWSDFWLNHHLNLRVDPQNLLCRIQIWTPQVIEVAAGYKSRLSSWLVDNYQRYRVQKGLASNLWDLDEHQTASGSQTRCTCKAYIAHFCGRSLSYWFEDTTNWILCRIDRQAPGWTLVVPSWMSFDIGCSRGWIYTRLLYTRWLSLRLCLARTLVSKLLSWLGDMCPLILLLSVAIWVFSEVLRLRENNLI